MAVPVNSTVPVISGTVEVGYTLTATTGTWTAGPTSFAFQWQRVNDNITDIDGATGHDYVITANDTGYTLQVKVIATNNSGDSVPAYSAETAEIPDDWFIVEDGTAKNNAVSYSTIQEIDTYHARRGNQAWGNLTIGQKKAAAVKAAEYMIERYRLQWKGERVTSEQSLDWPRNWVEYADYAFVTRNGSQVIGGFLYYPADQVPPEVKNAQAELALMSLSAALYAEQGQIIKRTKVDVIEVEYDQYSMQGRRFPAVDGRLAPLLENNTRLVRR
jgi:hypothetical protein